MPTLTFVDAGTSWCYGRFRVARTWIERLVGLLGTCADARPLLLRHCSSVHCFGMRYAIDVAFLDASGRVVCVASGVCPGSLLNGSGAEVVLERPASREPWPPMGRRLVTLEDSTTLGRHDGSDDI